MKADIAILSERPARRWRLWLFVACTSAVCVAAAPSQPDDADGAFVSLSNASMVKMMTGMAISPSGQVDRDFADMMIPHHQGAIDMAQAELRYGHDETLRRMAQEIIVDQQQEIVAMRDAEKGIK